MPSNSRNSYGFGPGGPLPALSPTPIISTRAPMTTDNTQEIGTSWIRTTTNQAWTMTGSAAGAATWSLATPGASDVDTLTGDAGGAISPLAGNINILGGPTATVTGAGNTLTVNASASGFPTTPYVVGAVGEAGYQTIAAAITAATGSGTDQTIFIQPGTYTENLTLVDGIHLYGASFESVVINGTHIPPAAGNFMIQNCTLADATDIFNSAVAGTTDMRVEDCSVNSINGYLFNIANWTGNVEIFNVNFSGSTNCGCITNTGGSGVEIFASGAGAGAGNDMVISGTTVMYSCNVDCPIDAQTGAVFSYDRCTFSRTLTFSNNSTGDISNCRMETGATAAIAHGSTGAVTLTNTTIDSANATPIGGAGAGALDIGTVDFVQNSVIAGTVNQTYMRSTDRIGPYIVGPTGNFATIAAAIAAANASGVDQTVFIQPGTYTEDLTLIDGVHIYGTSFESVVINGTHIPPAAGNFIIQNCTLADATDIFNSAVAGTTDMRVEDCAVNSVNGYLFNVANWTGNIEIFNTNFTGSTNCGCITNTGGSAIEIFASGVGAGAGNDMVLSGATIMYSCNVDCPIDAQTGTVFSYDRCTFSRTLTFSNDSTGDISNCRMATGATAAITHGSTGAVTLANTTIDSANATPIGGAGAGALDIGTVNFVQNGVIAGTVNQTYMRSTDRIGPYIVGPTGNFVTITEAIAAANASGVDQTVFIQPGTYTEDLTFIDGVHIYGTSFESVVINGTHIPPAAGNFIIQNCTLADATDIFNSAVAGTAVIRIEDCAVNSVNGYLFNIVNWTGDVEIFNVNFAGSTNCGCINNTGGMNAEMFCTGIGQGAGNDMVLSGAIVMYSCNVDCPIDMQTGAVFSLDRCTFSRTVTFSNNSTGDVSNSRFDTGATAAIAMGSAGNVELANTTISSTNAPSITGAGAGILSIGSTVFQDNAALAGTLTLAYDQTTTGLLNATGAHFLDSGAGNDITIQMGDNAGANNVSFNDSGGVPVLVIDSNGGITPAGAFAVVGAFTQTAGIANIGADAAANAVNIATGAAAKVATIGSVTGASSLDLLAGTGNFSLEGNVATTYAISNVGINTGQVDIAGGTGVRNINIGAGGTGAKTIGIGAAASADVITIGDATGAGSLDMACGTGNFSLEGNVATTYAISNVGINTGQVDIAGGTGVRNINIGAGGTGAKTIGIGAAASADIITIGDNTGAGSLDLVSGTGGITATGGAAGVTADFVTRTGDDITLESSAIVQSSANTGVAPTGATGDVNIIYLQEGIVLEGFVMGAGQTILAPRMDANGLIISADLTNLEGMEYNWGGALDNSRHTFTIGTDPAFFMLCTFRVADISGVENMLMGFKRSGAANNANFALYTDFAAIGPSDAISPGDSAIQTQLNTGGVVTTDTNDPWGDNTNHELGVYVDAAGNVTFTIDGIAPTATQVFQFDNGDIVCPMIRHIFNAVAPGLIHLQTLQVGYQ